MKSIFASDGFFFGFLDFLTLGNTDIDVDLPTEWTMYCMGGEL